MRHARLQFPGLQAAALALGTHGWPDAERAHERARKVGLSHPCGSLDEKRTLEREPEPSDERESIVGQVADTRKLALQIGVGH